MPESEAHLQVVREALTRLLDPGAILEGFVLVASYLNPETGETSDYQIWDHERPYYFTLGLLEASKLSIVRVLEERGEL